MFCGPNSSSFRVDVFMSLMLFACYRWWKVAMWNRWAAGTCACTCHCQPVFPQSSRPFFCSRPASAKPLAKSHEMANQSGGNKQAWIFPLAGVIVNIHTVLSPAPPIPDSSRDNWEDEGCRACMPPWRGFQCMSDAQTANLSGRRLSLLTD